MSWSVWNKWNRNEIQTDVATMGKWGWGQAWEGECQTMEKNQQTLTNFDARSWVNTNRPSWAKSQKESSDKEKPFRWFEKIPMFLKVCSKPRDIQLYFKNSAFPTCIESWQYSWGRRLWGEMTVQCTYSVHTLRQTYREEECVGLNNEHPRRTTDFARAKGNLDPQCVLYTSPLQVVYGHSLIISSFLYHKIHKPERP